MKNLYGYVTVKLLFVIASLLVCIATGKRDISVIVSALQVLENFFDKHLRDVSLED